VNDFSSETWLVLAFAAAAGIVGILYTAAAVIRDETRLRDTLAKADRLRTQWAKGRNLEKEEFEVEIVGQGPLEGDAKKAA
jgi:hypothetical protein